MGKWLPPGRGGYTAVEKADPKPQDRLLDSKVESIMDTKGFDYMVIGLAIGIVFVLIGLALIGGWVAVEFVLWLREQ